MLADLLKKIKSRQDELWVIFVVLLGISLIFGLWQRQFVHPVPELLRIENALPVSELSGETPDKPQNLPVTAGNFVASKNGLRYYLPNCAGANLIKEENKIWFRTRVEAEERGLTPSINCPGLREHAQPTIQK